MLSFSVRLFHVTYPFVSDKRKEYDKRYKAKLKEKKKLKESATGEGSNQTTTPVSCLRIGGRPLMNITNSTHVSVLDVVQVKSVYNKRSYVRRKNKEAAKLPEQNRSSICPQHSANVHCKQRQFTIINDNLQ